MKPRGLLPGGRIDRYVGSLFVGSYATALLCVVGLFLVIDLAANLDEFLRVVPGKPAPTSATVALYYAYHVPFLYLQVAPYVTLVAALFTGTRMLRDNEIVAVLDAGVSSRRLFLVMLVAGVFLGVSMFALREWATAELGPRRDALHDFLEERETEPVLKDIWMKDRAGSPVHLDELRLPGGDPERAEIVGLSAVVSQRGRWVSLEAEAARWTGGGWSLTGGWREDVDPLEQRRESVERLDLVSFTPAEVLLAVRGRESPLDLSFAEARELARRDPDNTQYQTLLQHQLTFPLAHLLLLLVGLPFVMRHERGRGLEGVTGGFLLCLFYFGADFVSRSLGLDGQTSPLMAAWLPVLVFGSLGVVLYSTMRS